MQTKLNLDKIVKDMTPDEYYERVRMLQKKEIGVNNRGLHILKLLVDKGYNPLK